MILWPRWLDRIYWRWYLSRHPYHTANYTLTFAWRLIQRDIAAAIYGKCEEYDWFEESA